MKAHSKKTVSKTKKVKAKTRPVKVKVSHGISWTCMIDVPIELTGEDAMDYISERIDYPELKPYCLASDPKFASEGYIGCSEGEGWVI